jgi:hypothetical protein
MKAAQTKTPAATPAAKSTPFFNKNGAQDFFATTEQQQPFFSAGKQASTGIQTKLTVGKPNDPYEREADAVADKVVRRLAEPAPAVQKNETTKPATPAVQAKCSECEQEEKLNKKELPTPPEKINRKAIFESNEERPVQRKPLPVLKSPLLIAPKPCVVQAKCSECEQEEKLQKKEDDKEFPEKILKKAIFESNEERPVQRKEQPPSLTKKTTTAPAIQACAACDQEEKLQKKETVETPKETLQTKPLAEAKDIKRVQARSEPAPIGLVKQATPAPSAPAVQACAACDAEEKTKEEEETDQQGPGLQKKPIFDTNATATEPLIQRTCRECDEGSEIFLKAAFVQLSAQSSGNGSRESIVAAAKGEIGKVQAKHDDGSGHRVGSDRLLEYFHVAAPNVWDDSIIETAGADMPSWCGIFSVWAHKKAGKDIGNWQMGRGVSAFHTLTTTDTPQPGDIGYIDKPKQHHCIIESVDGSDVHSIDGNSGLFSEVIRNTRPRSAYSGFFTAFGGASSGAVQTKEEAGSNTVTSPSVEQQLSSSKGSGQALPDNTRSGMEQNFGADFSSVKIHTDTSAVQMSKDLHAQAFTHGSDIYFNSGKFDTGSSSGQHLLAHELTHVVQQGSAPAQSLSRVAEPEPAAPEVAPAVQEIEQDIQPQVATKPDIQKDDPPTPPAAPAADADIPTIGQAVYDALDGWTSSGDSANILTQLRNRNKSVTDRVIAEVARLGSITVTATFEWLQSDMVSSDWTILRDQFVLIRVQGVEQLIANTVHGCLVRYTSEADSTLILTLFTGNSPLMGEQMTTVLTALQTKAGNTADDMAEWLFNDMTSLDADRLSTHFFNSGSVAAIHYASHWRAKKVRDLLAGWTGAADSTMIVTNFERTPAAMRSYVLYDLDRMCQQEWNEPASKSLQTDMWQSDYARLRILVPELPVWDIQRSWLDWLGQGISVLFDYVGALIEYAVCGIVGVVWGVLLVVRDIIAVIWDLLKAVYAFIGWIVHLIFPSLAREEADSFTGFFTSMGQFFGAPGTAISHMWNELVLESSLIEGPFRECRQAVFWMSRIANFLVNIFLILAGGYGLAKMVAEGIEALVNLVRAGDLLAALGRLPGRMFTAIRGLPSAVAKTVVTGIGRVVNLIRSPITVVESVRNTVAIVRLAASEEGYFNFLRQQAGRAVQGEAEFWRNRRAFWTSSAETTTGDLTNVEGKLVQAVETSVDDPAKAETLINEATTDANAANTEAEDLMNDIKGTAPETAPDFDSRLPQQWRQGSPDRPGMLDYSVAKLRAMNIPEDTIVAIIQNAALHANDDAANFFYHLNRFALRGQERLGQAGFDLVVRGLSGEPNFSVARMLMQKVSSSPQNLVNMMRTFTLEDIGSVRTRCPGGSENDFFNNLNTIATRINGTNEQIIALLGEAGQGQQGMDKLMEALERLGEGRFTPEQVRDLLEYGRRLAGAISAGGDEAARAVWGDAFVGRDPETGRIRVAAALTDERSGDRASAYIRARMRDIANTVLGGEGGTQVDPIRWGVIRDSILNTDLPTIVKYDILGEVWASSKVQLYRNLGYTVIREVSIRVLNPDGSPSGVVSRMDAVLRKDAEILYKEFKSTAAAGTTDPQDTVYPLLNEGHAERLQPFGARAEEAFGGPGMPDFAAHHVDIERPPVH